MAIPDVPRPAPVHAAPVHAGAIPVPALRVREPAELICAVPVLIGFHPRESLVLVASGDGGLARRLGLAVRLDLPPPEHAEAAVRAAVEGLLRDAPAGAAVIVVGAGSGAGPPHRELVDLAVRALERHRIDVHTRLWAESITRGAAWACYHPCHCTGVLPDPSATVLVAAAVAGGQVVHADRAELERLVAPADPENLRRREVLLIRAIDEAANRSNGGLDDPADGRRVLDAAIADAHAGRLILDDAHVLAIAGALTVPDVRDAALARCAGPSAAAAEQLWTALVRETPDPEAAQPAALLAVSALLRGDGALANVALDRAEQAWPGHRLTQILRSAADMGIRPSELRACLQPDVAGGGDASPGGRPRRTTRRHRRTE